MRNNFLQLMFITLNIPILTESNHMGGEKSHNLLTNALYMPMFYACVTLCTVQNSKVFCCFFSYCLGPSVPLCNPKCKLCTRFTDQEYQMSDAGLLPICTAKI